MSHRRSLVKNWLNTTTYLNVLCIDEINTYNCYFKHFTIYKSCVGKLFTSILNSRLNFFANDLNIIIQLSVLYRSQKNLMSQLKLSIKIHVKYILYTKQCKLPCSVMKSDFLIILIILRTTTKKTKK